MRIPKPLNLNTLNKIVCVDGVFDSFDDSGLTNSQFTNNAINTGTFLQSGGNLTMTGGTIHGVKYITDPDTVIAPAHRQLGNMLDVYYETLIKISDVCDLGGFALSHGDEAYTTANKKFWCGLFYDSAAQGDSGLKIIEPDGTVTEYTNQAISLNTDYMLKVVLTYNLEDVTEENFDSPPLNYTCYINAWLGTEKIINNFSLNVSDIYGERLDGVVGLAFENAFAPSCTVTFGYFAINRLDRVIEGKYLKSSLFKIGDLEFDLINQKYLETMKFSKNSFIQVYKRTNSSSAWSRRWHGFVDEILPEGEGRHNAIVKLTGTHFGKILDQRQVTRSFTAKKTDYILTDGTFGVLVTEVNDIITFSDVDPGTIDLTKSYFKKKIRDIILLLSAEEDTFPVLDETDDLHFNSVVNVTDSAKSFFRGDGKLMDYRIDEVGPDEYSKCIVLADDIELEFENPNKLHSKGGSRIKPIVDSSITTHDEALRRAQVFFSKNITVFQGEIVIKEDLDLEVGHIISLTLPESNLGIFNKRFLILDIDENFFRPIQTLTISEAGSLLTPSDLLYDVSKQTDVVDIKEMDASAITTKAVMIDIVIGMKLLYKVEISPNDSDWTIWAQGKGMICNRGMTVMTALLSNLDGPGTYAYDVQFDNIDTILGDSVDFIFQFGTGTTPAKTTDTAIETSVGTIQDIRIQSKTYLDSYKNYYVLLECKVLNSQLNGNNLSEVTFYPDVLSHPAFNQTSNQYGTHSNHAPYNSDTQITARVVHTPYAKTSSFYFRFMARLYMVQLPKHNLKRV